MANNIFPSVDNKNRSDVINAEHSVHPERSVFPYGCTRILTMNEGYLYPVDCFFVLPGDSFDIDIANYLESINPFVDRQYSGMKLTFHAYYNKCEHEWKGWKNYATKGRRGNVTLHLPRVFAGANSPGSIQMVDSLGNLLMKNNNDALGVSFDTQGGLISYLTGVSGKHISNQTIPTGITDSTTLSWLNSHYCGANTQVNRTFRLDGETVTNLVNYNADYNAIPFAMYQRIYRDFYLNQNLVKDNKEWFPDDEDDWVIPYVQKDFYNLYSHYSLNPPSYYSLVPNNVDGSDSSKHADTPVLTALRCRQFNGDAFTTCVPFLERNGDTNLFNVLQAINLDNTSTQNISGVHQYKDFGIDTLGQNPVTMDAYTWQNVNLGAGEYSSFQMTLKDNQGNYSKIYSTFNMNQLKELAAATLWSVRNAQAQGDYNSLIRAHYGINPRSEDRSPTYIGGCVQRLEFNNVVSSAETVNQPLGTKTTNASSGGSASLGHFEVPDFGYVMILASLVPDTFYTQGLRKEFDSSMTGAELPWPEFANLQKENVLHKRLLLGSYNDKLIGFNERFLDYKYRENRLLGHMSDFQDSKFKSMTFARYFEPTTQISSIDNEFVTMSPYNLRFDMYSVPSQPHYILQFGDNIRMVRALPYASKESTLTNIA